MSGHLRARAGVLAAAGALLLAACSGGGSGARPGAAGTGTRVAAQATGAGPRPGIAATPGRWGPYAALGDSYTSAPQIPDQVGQPAGCARSSRNYPSLVAEGLGLKAADFRDVSCSGATTAALTAPQATRGEVNPAQATALSGRTRLVTVGIGGNDVGFVALLTRCVREGMSYNLAVAAKGTGAAGDAPCQQYFAGTGTDEVQRRIDAAGKRLARALGQVKRRAPQARIYVVGYPALLPPDDSGCAEALGLAPGDVLYLHQKEQQLNAMLRQRAVSAGAVYVDTYTPSIGHDACAPAAVRWIEPLFPSAPAAPAHPNARGEAGMAAAVLRAIRASA